MSLKSRPSDWHFIVSFPPEMKDTSQTLELSYAWSLTVNDTIEYARQNFTFSQPLQITAKTSRTSNGSEIVLHLEGFVNTECGKCLSPLTLAIQEDFVYAYVLRPNGEVSRKDSEGFDDADGGWANSAEEFCETEKVEIPVAAVPNSIDIGDVVWECLVVSLPVYATCPDGCPDISEFLSEDDQRDPRLLALADMLCEDVHGDSEQNRRNDTNS